jgi:hypothetical protein
MSRSSHIYGMDVSRPGRLVSTMVAVLGIDLAKYVFQRHDVSHTNHLSPSPYQGPLAPSGSKPRLETGRHIDAGLSAHGRPSRNRTLRITSSLVVHPANGWGFSGPRLTTDHADPREPGDDPSRACGER